MKKIVFFLGLRRFSILNVLHKGLLMQDWVFRLGRQMVFFRNLTFLDKFEVFRLLSARKSPKRSVVGIVCFDSSISDNPIVSNKHISTYYMSLITQVDKTLDVENCSK